jgi:hypothetical protein
MLATNSGSDTLFTSQGAILASKLGTRMTYCEFRSGTGAGHAGVRPYRIPTQVLLIGSKEYLKRFQLSIKYVERDYEWMVDAGLEILSLSQA